MDPQWLWLIIPGGYIIISTFFLCFPNLLHKRHRYSHGLFNQLLETNSLLCIGHRGGCFEGPENTLQLFRKTYKSCHQFELDVCYTKDKQLVVHHDTNLRRTCGVNKDISELNYSQLPRFLESYEPYGHEQLIKTEKNKIPLLDQLFSQFPDIPLNIQLKTPSQDSINEFDRLVRKHHRESITVWGANNEQHNQKLRNINPEVNNFYSIQEVLKIFLLFIFGLLPFACIRPGMLQIPLVTAPLSKWAYSAAGSGCKKCLCCFIMGVFHFFNFLSRLFIPHLKKRGILTFYWIVNEQQDFKTAVSMGCSGIMTDKPTALQRFLKNEDIYYQGSNQSI